MRILPPDIDRHDFYQNKFRFYRRFAYWVVVISVLCMPMFFISDCQLYGHFQLDTLPARVVPFAALGVFVALAKTCRDYKVFVPCAYLVMHCILWCTIWAVYFLPDKTHFSEGSIITQFLFFAVSFAAPWTYGLISQLLAMGVIIMTHPLIHYQNFDILLSLNLPCCVGICAAHLFMERLYVRNYRTSKRLRYLSLYDELTGAHNRNLTRQLVKTNSSRFIDDLVGPICVAMMDIDFFKKVNDEHGHLNGDKTLKDFAHIVESAISPKDYFIRWGGEEFILIMPQTNRKKAIEFMEGIRKQVEDFKGGVCPITISVGIALYDGDSYKLAIDNADKALYQAKNSGRNKVVMFED